MSAEKLFGAGMVLFIGAVLCIDAAFKHHLFTIAVLQDELDDQGDRLSRAYNELHERDASAAGAPQ